MTAELHFGALLERLLSCMYLLKIWNWSKLFGELAHLSQNKNTSLSPTC
jgi:hypothetical protein